LSIAFVCTLKVSTSHSASGKTLKRRLLACLFGTAEPNEEEYRQYNNFKTMQEKDEKHHIAHGHSKSLHYHFTRSDALKPYNCYLSKK
jgi:hypothetical protein